MCFVKTLVITVFAGGGASKGLSVLALACFLVSPAIAGEIDLSSKPQDIPTLDYLKNNNMLDSLGSAYTLTKVEEKGDNTITKFEWDTVTQSLVPQYYRVDKNYLNDSGFIDHEVRGDYGAKGAAISNSGNIDYDILGDFIDNKAHGPMGSSYGGAVYNSGGMGDIIGDFIKNRAYNSYYCTGGAIYNTGTVGNITGDFIENSTYTDYRVVGGAISNEGTIGDITGDFIGNSAISTANYKTQYSQNAYGGAIYNYAKQTDGLYDFTDSSMPEQLVIQYASIQVLNDDGSVYKTLYMIGCGSVKEFEDLVAEGAVIGLSYMGVVETVSKSEWDDLLKQEGFEEEINSMCYQTDPKDLYTFESPDTISYTEIIRKHPAHISLKNSNILFNHAETTKGDAKGGAIYAENSTVKLTVNDGTTKYISGNYTRVGDTIDDNAIYMKGGNLIFDSVNGSTIRIDDNIKGEKYYTYIIGDKESKLILNNHIYDSTVNLVGTNLIMLNDNNLDGNVVNLHSGTLSMLNNQVGRANLKDLTVALNTNLLVDVDLANNQMDRITSEHYGAHSGTLTVSGMNLLSDMQDGVNTTLILFADQGLKDNVQGTLETPTPYQTTAYTPIYKYNVSYDNQPDAGYFVFNRGGLVNGNPSDNFNPAVLDSPVAAQAGSQSAVSETVRFAFQHMDTFSQMPYAERIAMIHNNRYAISEGTPKFNTDLYQAANKGYWVRPYTSFEKINLHNGPDVDAIVYGTLIGLDSDFKPLRNGWYNVQSLYAGYNGSSLSYSGVDTTLNGGVLGLTETFYKDNFFTAITATAGASLATGSTMYGNEEYAMLMGGLGAKGGYNFEFKNGKYIFQPIMFANYSFVNTFDYTNSAGVRMSSTPLHTLQINPQLKFISNLKNGWQPYASVGFVWNVLNSSKVKANDVVLPKMTVDPYVEYGVGIQRNWKDKYTGFAQAMVRNGGRNGVALTFGFRWALGKEAL